MIRKLLIWVVMALLPLQGYAAAAMISCGPMHAQMSAAAEHPHHHDAGAAHQSHDHHQQDGPAGDRQAPSNDTDLFKFKCSACAACCTGSAAPSPVPPAVTADASHGVRIPFFESPEGGIVLDGLDRPPRTSLA
jgi:hypothetical protein